MTEPSHPIFARLYDPVMKPAERTILAEHRRYLVDKISGTVLDLGAGTGAMFPYFGEATADGGDLTLFAIEPDPHMRQQAVERARDLRLDIEIETLVRKHSRSQTIRSMSSSHHSCSVPSPISTPRSPRWPGY